MKIDLYTQKGEKNGTVELPKEIFEVPFNEDLVHQALILQLANRRYVLAYAKTRKDVRGGGRKPYKQKGTGRARQGTIRAPQMKGGAVVFGPTKNRNFAKDMPQKQRRKALFCALSEKLRSNGIIALEEYKAEKAKTKELAVLLKKLPVGKDTLIVLPKKDQIIERSSKNLPFTKTLLANYLNIHDLQRFETVILLKDSINVIKETFLSK